MITIINTTKQTIHYLNEKRDLNNESVKSEAEVIAIPPTKGVPQPMIIRKRNNRTEKVMIDGKEKEITFANTISEQKVNIPEEKDGVLYIVNKIIFHAFPERKDFILPTSIKQHKLKVNGKDSLVCTKFIKRELNK